MTRYLKMEMIRSFGSKKFILALLIGFFLSIWHYFVYIFPIRNYINSAVYPLSSYNLWIGGEYYSLQSMLYYLLIPILCALPYGDSWLYDCTSSVGGQACVRGDKKGFILTKFFIFFLTGAVISMLPLLFDFALTSSTLPALIPQKGLGLSPVKTNDLMANLFYSNPFLYTILYIGIDGVFFGLLNVLSFASRLITHNKYMAVLTPFLCYMIVHFAGTTLSHTEICPSGFLRPCQQFTTTWGILLLEMAVIAGIDAGAAIKYIREEQGIL